MAKGKEKQDEDLDLGVENAGGGKKKLIIFIAIGVLVLLLGGGGAAWFLMSGDEAPADEQAAVESKPKEQGPALYQELKPVFVVNLPPGGKFKMLQLGIQVMAKEQAAIDFVKQNDPMVRNALLNLFGNQNGDKLMDRAGKEALQAEVLNTINGLADQQGGGKLDAVYFSSFVMQ